MSLFASDLPDDTVGDAQVPGSGRTPPHARTPRTGAPPRLDDWGEPAPRGGSRRWLLVAALVPWVVVVAIVLGGGRSDDEADAPAPATVPTPAPTATTSPVPAATAPAAPADGATPTDVVALSTSRAPDRRGEAEGLALVVARSWLSTRPAGPPIEGLDPAPGAADRYVEHLAVEGVDHPARGALVVTVRAIVLPVEGDTYGTARSLRVAVPVRLDADGVRIGGQPWRLASPTPAIDLPERAPVDDTDLMLAAVDAVRAVGYREVSLTSLSRTSGWAWVAEVEARAPDEDTVRTHELWLRTDVGRLVVAGAIPGRPATPPSAEPSSTPGATEPEGTP